LEIETDVIDERKNEKIWLIQKRKTGQRYVLKQLNEEQTDFPLLLHSKRYETGFHAPKFSKLKQSNIMFIEKTAITIAWIYGSGKPLVP